ncbi:MAG: hypothetical protein U5R48_10610 [Gammaproteobacteria bacterium]|nr:hypothetical protein [Gammaproteobacteria bacterium]
MDTELAELVGRTDEAGLAEAEALIARDPNRIHRLMSLLHCGRRDCERGAALLVERLSRDHPDWLEPQIRRLFRVASASDDDRIRSALAGTFPRLKLSRGEAGRIAFVLESWLDEADPELQRASMTALVDLIPRRPDLAGRIRDCIETRAARGSPVAIRHGRALLEQLREF